MLAQISGALELYLACTHWFLGRILTLVFDQLRAIFGFALGVFPGICSRFLGVFVPNFWLGKTRAGAFLGRLLEFRFAPTLGAYGAQR